MERAGYFARRDPCRALLKARVLERPSSARCRVVRMVHAHGLVIPILSIILAAAHLCLAVLPIVFLSPRQYVLEEEVTRQKGYHDAATTLSASATVSSNLCPTTRACATLSTRMALVSQRLEEGSGGHRHPCLPSAALPLCVCGGCLDGHERSACSDRHPDTDRNTHTDPDADSDAATDSDADFDASRDLHTSSFTARIVHAATSASSHAHTVSGSEL